MSSKLTPGQWNPDTLARTQQGGRLPDSGWGAIGHDRYGRSLGHRGEAGMPDEPAHVSHAAPRPPRARAAQPSVKLGEVARFTGGVAA